MAPFPLSLPEAWGDFFLWYLLWDRGPAPEGKYHNIVGLIWMGPSPLGFLTLGIVHTELSAIHQWQLGFSYPRHHIFIKTPGHSTIDPELRTNEKGTENF